MPQRSGSAPVVSPPIQSSAPIDKVDSSSKQPGSKISKSAVVSRAHRILPTKKAKIIAVGIVVIIVATIAWSFTHQQNTASTSDPNKPEYKTVLPEGKTVDELKGWKRVSPPGKDPVFAYVDEIDGIPVSVSEQPLPKSFEGNVDSQVAELAKKFNATTKIDANGTTVWVGTSAKGPQSAIFSKMDLLILIKSQKKVDSKAWATYAKSLNYINHSILPSY
jgi:hypothetical protein